MLRPAYCTPRLPWNGHDHGHRGELGWGDHELHQMDEINQATLPTLARREDFLPREDVTVDMVVNGLLYIVTKTRQR